MSSAATVHTYRDMSKSACSASIFDRLQGRLTLPQIKVSETAQALDKINQKIQIRSRDLLCQWWDSILLVLINMMEMMNRDCRVHEGINHLNNNLFENGLRKQIPPPFSL